MGVRVVIRSTWVDLFFSIGLSVINTINTLKREPRWAAARYPSSTWGNPRAVECHVVATWQGRDSLIRCHLPGYTPSLFSPRRFSPMRFRHTRFFFPFRFTVFVTAHTLTHLRPGPSVVTGLMGSLSMRVVLSTPVRPAVEKKGIFQKKPHFLK